jgi:hypothetical protein
VVEIGQEENVGSERVHIRPPSAPARVQVSMEGFLSPPAVATRAGTKRDRPVSAGSPCDSEEVVQYAEEPAKRAASHNAWRTLLPGPPPIPACHCGESTVERTVKDGKNRGKIFFVCRRPAGKPGTPGARCNFFRWQDDQRKRAARS